MTQHSKLVFLQTLFVGCMMLSNMVGIKVVDIGPLQTSVSIWLLPITFLVTDIIAEVKGKKYVNNLVISTSILMIISYIFVTLSVSAEPAERFTINEEFKIIFQTSARFFLASIIAFVLAQLHDIWAFEYIKEKTHGKFLWLRNNASTIVSQFIDSVVFIFIAFYHITPKFDVAYMWQLILPLYVLKVLLAVADTPFCYWGVKWLRKSEKDV